MLQFSRFVVKYRSSALVLLALAATTSAHAGRRLSEAPPVTPDDLPLIAAADIEAEAAGPGPQLVAAASAPPRPSQNVTINLICPLVKKGLLTQEEADELIEQAENDAAMARAQAASVQGALAQMQKKAEQFTPDPALMALGDDAMRVTYIPDTVKAEMREQIKQDVMDSAKRERWAMPKLVPEWALHVRLFGDIRVRYEYNAFPSGNDNTGAFPNFNAINTGPPFDTSGTVFSPQINVDRDRNRLRLRARVGLEA